MSTVYATITIELSKAGLHAICEDIEEDVFCIDGNLQRLVDLINDAEAICNPDSTFSLADDTLTIKSEKAFLSEEIAKTGHHRKTNAMKMRKKVLRPQEGSVYYYMKYDRHKGIASPLKATWHSSEWDELVLSEGNVFFTFEEAQAYCDAFNKAILPVINEHRLKFGLAEVSYIGNV